jgi:hypothetical protein
MLREASVDYCSGKQYTNKLSITYLDGAAVGCRSLNQFDAMRVHRVVAAV